MKNELEQNKDILETTIEIEEKFPELAKFIEEMPETISNENIPEINLTVLEEYEESLNSLLKKYAVTHTIKNKKQKK